MPVVTRDRARIFRITHIDNVEWVARNGLCCRSSQIQDPNFKEIGNPEIIARRRTRNVPIHPGGTLNDYIPFYFTPYSPMLYNILTGFNGLRRFPKSEIVIWVADLPPLRGIGIDWVFSDRHAVIQYANFYREETDLQVLDWDSLQARDFKRDAERPEKMDRYMAEALIHLHLPVTGLKGLVCHGAVEKEKLKLILMSAGVQLPVEARPDWYF